MTNFYWCAFSLPTNQMSTCYCRVAQKSRLILIWITRQFLLEGVTSKSLCTVYLMTIQDKIRGQNGLENMPHATVHTNCYEVHSFQGLHTQWHISVFSTFILFYLTIKPDLNRWQCAIIVRLYVLLHITSLFRHIFDSFCEAVACRACIRSVLTYGAETLENRRETNKRRKSVNRCGCGWDKKEGSCVTEYME